jgi:hypothetical protein
MQTTTKRAVAALGLLAPARAVNRRLSVIPPSLAAVRGALAYAGQLLRHGDVYRGSNAYYRSLQQGNAGAALLRTTLPKVLADHVWATANATRSRIAARVREDYSSTDVGGYAGTYDKGGASLGEQQRGLVLRPLGPVLEELPDSASVIEIGTANGDVVAHLAHEHPRLSFLGVDLNVDDATAKHSGMPNLSFHRGYALDLLSSRTVTGDVVFASSTFIVFTPAELVAYLAAFKAAGVQHVVLNEPTWGGWKYSVDEAAQSWHLEGDIWHHGLAGYLRESGFVIASFQEFHYQHPVSTRPDLRIALITARSSGSA